MLSLASMRKETFDCEELVRIGRGCFLHRSRLAIEFGLHRRDLHFLDRKSAQAQAAQR